MYLTYIPECSAEQLETPTIPDNRLPIGMCT